jgi:hypothetical protein
VGAAWASHPNLSLLGDVVEVESGFFSDKYLREVVVACVCSHASKLVDGVCSQLHLELASTLLSGGRDALAENCFCFLATVLHPARDVETYIAIVRDLLQLTEEGSPFLQTFAEFTKPGRRAPKMTTLLGVKESGKGELPFDMKVLFEEITSDPSVLAGVKGESFNDAVARYCVMRALVGVSSQVLERETRKGGFLFDARHKAESESYVIKRAFNDGGKGVKRDASGSEKNSSQALGGHGAVKGKVVWTDARKRLLVASLKEAGNDYTKRCKFPSEFVTSHAAEFVGVKAQVVSNKLKNIFKTLHDADETGVNVAEVYAPLMEPRVLICPRKKGGEWRTNPGG